MQEIAEGIFAYVQEDGGWCVNNAGLVAAGGVSVLVDTAATEKRAARLRDAVSRVAPDGPGVLVNTHHHGDHIFGNALFAPPATIVAHELARAEMIEAGLSLRDLWPDVDWGDPPLTLPTLTFRDAITLYAGELRLEVFHVGPAHTTNDVVVWVPDRRVLFAGDIVMSGVTPFCLMGSIAGSLAAIERLRALDPAVVVAGHGPVAGPEIFDANEAYLRWIQRVAADGLAAGRTPLDAARDAGLDGFADLIDPERVVGNLHRAYVEQAQDAGQPAQPLGAPIDLLVAFRGMVEFNGGLPTCHA